MNILVADELDAQAHEWLAQRHRVDVRLDLASDPSALRAASYKAEAIVLPRQGLVNRQFLDFAPLLRAVARMGGGSDNIDMEACRDRNVQVVITNSAHTKANAEYLLAGLLMLARPGLAHAAAGLQLPSNLPKGRELNACTVGILGLSPTALALVPMLRGLGIRPLVYDFAVHAQAPIWSQLKVTPVSLRELLSRCDVISLQVLYAARFAGILNERVLAHCKPGQSWVSITRSSIFAADALADALEDGRISAMLLDGAEAEFRHASSRLSRAPQLICTPRIGSHTHDARSKASWLVARRLHEILTTPAARSWAVAEQPTTSASHEGEASAWAATRMVDDEDLDAGGFAPTRLL